MTDTLELEKIMRKSGKTKKEVAKALGLSEQGFLLKLNNKNEFKASEMKTLVELLSCDLSIFFTENSELNSTTIEGG